MDQFSVDKNK